MVSHVADEGRTAESHLERQDCIRHFLDGLIHLLRGSGKGVDCLVLVSTEDNVFAKASNQVKGTIGNIL